MFKAINLEVIGDQKIVCEGCEERIEKVLKAVPGVDKVRARARNQRIEVLLDTAVVEPTALVERLSQAGYEARVANAA